MNPLYRRARALADKLSRWLNIVVGAFFGIMAIGVLVMMLMGNPSVLAINMVFGIVVSALTVWIALKSEWKNTVFSKCLTIESTFARRSIDQSYPPLHSHIFTPRFWSSRAILSAAFIL